MSVLKIQSLDLHLPVSALAVDVVDDFVVCGDVQLARNLQPWYYEQLVSPVSNWCNTSSLSQKRNLSSQSVLVCALYGESYDLLYNTYRDHHLVPHCSESGDCSDDQEDCVLQNLDGDVTGCETSADRSSTIVTKSVSWCCFRSPWW